MPTRAWIALSLALMACNEEGDAPAPPVAVDPGAVEWVEEGGVPTDSHLFAAWSDGRGETWIVGDGSTIVRGRPGRWESVDRPDAAGLAEGEAAPTLRALHGQPGGLLVAAGDAGIVLVRTGSSWSVEAAGLTDQDLQAALAHPDGRAFVAGYEGTILRRETSGDWAEEDASSVDSFAALATTSSEVWALGGFGAALRLAEGAWERTDTDTGRALAAAWSQDDEVFAVGLEGTFLRWDGAAWSAIEHHFGPYLRAIWGRAPGDLFAAGWDGAVLHWDGETVCELPAPRWRFEAITGDAETITVAGVGGRAWTAEVTGKCVEKDGDAGVPPPQTDAGPSEPEPEPDAAGEPDAADDGGGR